MNLLTRLSARLQQFYRKGLWETPSHAARRPLTRLALATARRLVLTVRAFLRERMQYRAASLTYTTLLSAVPLLSVVVAIAKGFGLDALIEQKMRASLSGQPEMADALIGFVNSYLSHTQGGVFLGFGLLLLLWTLLSLTGAIETTFNQIWQVKRERSTFRKITDYTAVFFLLPVLLLVTAGLSLLVTSFTESLPDVLLLRPAAMTVVRLLPYVLMCLLFAAAFAFMPNTKVSLRSALLAGIPSGVAFQALQFFYIHSQIWLSSYNAIYGSFAALPLFMLWCQISWYICLFGATLSYVDQHIDYFYYGRSYTRVSRRYHDFLCLVLTAEVCRRFARRLPPATAEALAHDRRIPLRLATDILDELCRSRVLIEVAGDGKGSRAVFMPACDTRLLTPAFVLDALHTAGNALARHDLAAFGQLWTGFDHACGEALQRELADCPLHHFAKETQADEASAGTGL